MTKFIVRLAINAVALWVASLLVGGIQLTSNFGGLLVVVIVFGLINALIRPVLQILSLPITLLTLGIFALVINAGMLLLTAALTSGLAVNGFWAAFWGSIIIAIVSTLLSQFLADKKRAI